MPEFEDFLKEIRIITDKLEKITIKLERHLAQHETTGTNAKWLKWFFDFARTAILIYIAINQIL